MSNQTKSEVPVLNAANAKKFGKKIFTMKNGVVTFLQLCNGTLKDGKVGKRHLHCAVGEVLVAFGPNRKKVASLLNDGDVDEAIAYLATKADLKDNSENGRNVFQSELVELMHTNDEIVSHDASKSKDLEFFNRARDVQSYWMENIVPLLKD